MEPGGMGSTARSPLPPRPWTVEQREVPSHGLCVGLLVMFRRLLRSSRLSGPGTAGAHRWTETARTFNAYNNLPKLAVPL